MGRTARGIVAVVVAAAVAVAGCSGDEAPADGNASVITDPVDTSETTSSSTTTEATTTTEDPNDAVKREVEEAYLAYWDAFLEIYSRPNPENPLIEKHTAGTVKQATLDSITQFILDGESIRAPDDPDHWRATVLSVEIEDESTAEVVVCAVDGGRYYDNSADTPIDDDVVTKLIVATLIIEDAEWKVAESTITERQDGVWDCDA